MKEFLNLLISATAGSIGFAMLFKLRLRMLPWATLGALLDAIVYLLCGMYTPNLFLSTIAGAAAATIYSDIMAPRLQVPVTLLLLPSIVPLIPGGSLYYTMACIISVDKDGIFKYGLGTMEAALGIAIGILISSLFYQEYRQFKNVCKTHKDNIQKN
jgi:uncharacterized membrane protein YjjB (DUF3815 family)